MILQKIKRLMLIEVVSEEFFVLQKMLKSALFFMIWLIVMDEFEERGGEAGEVGFVSEEGTERGSFFGAWLDDRFITRSLHSIDEVLNEDRIILRVDSKRIAHAKSDPGVFDIERNVKGLFRRTILSQGVTLSNSCREGICAGDICVHVHGVPPPFKEMQRGNLLCCPASPTP